jgi:WD40 repeat protein
VGICELLNGRLLAVSKGGRVEEVALPRSLFFTSSSVASNGKLIVGFSDRGFTVLDQHLRPVWSRPDPRYNVIALALSPDGTKVAVAAADLGAARWTAVTWRLFTISSSGRQSDIGRFSYTKTADELVTVSWDPTGRRLVFNDKGAIRVVDVESDATRVIGVGLSPTWSPDGRWFAYRTGEGQIALMNAESGAVDARRFGAHLTSFAHWSPNSRYFFVDEARGRSSSCISVSKLVVYDISNGRSRVAYDTCGHRDWYFGWIQDPRLWLSSARSLAMESGSDR